MIGKIIADENFTEEVMVEDREISSIYCCDLLSIAMAKAPMDGIWVTVMANANTLAVASLADISCVVFADGTRLTPQDSQTAKDKGINVLYTNLDIFTAAVKIKEILGL